MHVDFHQGVCGRPPNLIAQVFFMCLLRSIINHHNAYVLSYIDVWLEGRCLQVDV